jgi:AraC-like DNA-binding protein
MYSMNYDFSIINNPSSTASIALRTVYILHSDPSYDVRKGVVPSKDLVALRTFAGTGTVIIEGVDEIVVHPGTLLFFEHSKVRRYYCSSEKWNFWWFEFTLSGGLGFPQNELLTIETLEDELRNCKACLELLRKNNTASNRVASATFSLMLSKWMLYFENNNNYNPHRETIEKILEYMNSNLVSISLEKMASMAGLCERRFRQVFEIITGVPPKKYLDMLRMRTAEGLLRNTHLSVNEIANNLGYSSQFHFSKAFKSIYGTSPSLYRRSIQ